MHREGGVVGVGDGVIRLDQDHALGEVGDDLCQLPLLELSHVGSPHSKGISDRLASRMGANVPNDASGNTPRIMTKTEERPAVGPSRGNIASRGSTWLRPNSDELSRTTLAAPRLLQTILPVAVMLLVVEHVGGSRYPSYRFSAQGGCLRRWPPMLAESGQNGGPLFWATSRSGLTTFGQTRHVGSPVPTRSTFGLAPIPVTRWPSCASPKQTSIKPAVTTF